MSGPLVSLIIPCHNAAAWLRPALESAFAQTWPAKEIILVDDGSTDGSLAIAREFEPRGLLIATQPHRGQSAACNHGLSLSRGEFVKFFDADDLLSADAVAIQVRALCRAPGRLAYGEWARFHQDPVEAEFVRRPGWHDGAPVDWLVALWENGQPMMQCGQFLLPRTLLDRAGGWDERLSLINDFELFTRLVVRSEGVVFTPGARLYYRSGLPGSLSRRRSRAAWESAALSAELGTGHLLAAEDSTRTRRVAAGILQSLVHEMYPNVPSIVRRLERRVTELGGSTLPAPGGRAFQCASRVLGWKAARWLQLWAGKYPRPLAR